MHYWYYYCPNTNTENETIGSVPINDEDAEKRKSSKVPNQHFHCEGCGGEHEGYLKKAG